MRFFESLLSKRAITRLQAIILAIIIIVAVSGGIVYYYISLPGPAAEKETIKIGLICAFGTPYGDSEKAALEIGVEEINAMGGILGRRVELVVEDWKREVPLAVAAYRKLVMTDGCLLVITEGTEGTTACREEAVKLYPEYPHIQFCLWTAAQGVTMDVLPSQWEKYKFLFRIYPHTGMTWEPDNIRDLVSGLKKMGAGKLALVIEDIAWTEPYITGAPQYGWPPLKDLLEANGIPVVFFAKNAIGEKMFLPIFEQIAASGADVIYWVTGYTDTVTLAKQWAESPAKNLPILSQSGACSYRTFWNMTDGACLGWVTMYPEIDIPFTNKTKTFLEKLRAKGVGYLASTAGAYETPYVLKAAIEKVGSVKNVDAIIEALEAVRVQNAFWTWKFDEHHNPVYGYPYYTIPWGQFQKDGKFVVVNPEEIRALTNPQDNFIPVKVLRGG